MGRQQQQSGNQFEIVCANRPQAIGVDLSIKHVERNANTIYTTAPDLEFIDFKSLYADCKFTINEFTKAERTRLYEQAQDKYKHMGSVILIFGERRGKTRLNWDNVVVLFNGNLMMNYDDYLHYLKSLSTTSISEIGGV